jgi:hypothetical protein
MIVLVVESGEICKTSNSVLGRVFWATPNKIAKRTLKKSKYAKNRMANVGFFKSFFLRFHKFAQHFMHKNRRIFIFGVDILKKYCIII